MESYKKILTKKDELKIFINLQQKWNKNNLKINENCI